MSDREQRVEHLAERSEAELGEATELLDEARRTFEAAHEKVEAAELYAMQGAAYFEMANDRFKAARRAIWLGIALLLLAMAVQAVHVAMT